MRRQQTAVRLDPDMLAQLQVIATDEGRSVGDVIRRLIASALDAKTTPR